MPRESARRSHASAMRCRCVVWIEYCASRKPNRSQPAENTRSSTARVRSQRSRGSPFRRRTVTCTGWRPESAGRVRWDTPARSPAGLRPAPRRAPPHARNASVFCSSRGRLRGKEASTPHNYDSGNSQETRVISARLVCALRASQLLIEQQSVRRISRAKRRATRVGFGGPARGVAGELALQRAHSRERIVAIEAEECRT